MPVYVVVRNPNYVAPMMIGLARKSIDSAIASTFKGFGTPRYTENAQLGVSAIQFTANDQFLFSPGGSQWNLRNTFTITSRFRLDPYQIANIKSKGYACLISNYDGKNGYEILIDANGEVTAILITSTGTHIVETSMAYIIDGGWHEIAFQRGLHKNIDTLGLFIDGIPNNTIKCSGSTSTSIADFTIGNSAYGLENYPFSNGTIDELEILDITKYDWGGYKLSTVENLPSSDTILLMHFDSNNPSKTMWYNITMDNYWAAKNSSWNTSSWIGGSLFRTKNNWNNYFRPTKMRITGIIEKSNIITLKNSAQDYTIANTLAAPEVTLNLSFQGRSHDQSYDFEYLDLTGFSKIDSIEVDTEPVIPKAS